MKDELKEFVFVWGIIFIIIGIVTFYVKKLYFFKIHDFVSQIVGGESLSVSLFWVGWLGVLILAYTWYANKF